MMQARVADDIALLKRVGWVEDAIAKLDEGAEKVPVVGRYLRGLVFADLPPRFGKARVAIADLEATLAEVDRFPFEPERGLYRALAAAYRTLGDRDRSQEMLRRAGVASLEPDTVPEVLFDASVTRADGFRFGRPHLIREAEGVYRAEGFDFATIVFLVTDAGVVAIDAGTNERNAGSALAALRTITDAPVTHVIFTHGHWDHVGGLAALVGPKTTIIAQAHFPEELARSRAFKNPFHTYFWGTQPIPLDVHVDRLVAERQTLRLGSLELALIPVRGGETDDALFIHDRTHGLLFVGDAFMPYVGPPFVGGGSAEGYLEAIRTARSLAPRKLIHGHVSLTNFWTVEALPGLETALAALYRRAVDGAHAATPVADLLHDNFLPASLREAPAAVIAYLVTRDAFVQRAHRQAGGYWEADGGGIDVFTQEEWAAALDALGGHDAGPFVRVVNDLVARGDAAMALRVADAGLRTHPGDADLRTGRARALRRLQERTQLINPFRFIIYSQWSGADVPPVSGRTP